MKQLGLIFMSEDDANALIEKVRPMVLPTCIICCSSETSQALLSSCYLRSCTNPFASAPLFSRRQWQHVRELIAYQDATRPDAEAVNCKKVRCSCGNFMLLSRASICISSLAKHQVHNWDAQVREQNPKLAKQSRVLKVSMDNVYDFAVTPEVDKKTAGVSFCFMPDLKQVQKALEVRPVSCSGLRQVLARLWHAAVRDENCG